MHMSYNTYLSNVWVHCSQHKAILSSIELFSFCDNTRIFIGQIMLCVSGRVYNEVVFARWHFHHFIIVIMHDLLKVSNTNVEPNRWSRNKCVGYTLTRKRKIRVMSITSFLWAVLLCVSQLTSHGRETMFFSLSYFCHHQYGVYMCEIL